MFASTSFADSSAAPAGVDSLGCLHHQLHQSQELLRPDLSFYRKRVDDSGVSQVRTDASDRGFLLGISMSQQHRRSIFRGRRGAQHDFARGGIYIRDFSEDYRADIHGAFDFMLVELPPRFFEYAADHAGVQRVSGLATVTGQHDPVLEHLAHALAPALARPDQASMLFVDQLGIALGTHLLQRYGGARTVPTVRSTGLSRMHEERAKQMLLEKVKGNVSIPEIARECNMSASYFLRAFKETTGQTPHQWLMTQRVQRAREFLRDTELPLAEVAVACNFYDQSHFCRVFAQVVGTSPGSWRRNSRN
ncbi:helix-turn-helix transcriptional regulator [Herbaspirillum sp. LeCh32-8]|uniref:helix-turn-helix transcriptional regulator n=1 Tax=Herbaspirillum sp. LeCh32-8 TaxID=2821356 RepID=UPI001AE14EDE|nr:AraC family transcriptional regulator [Herbaspirillum sp. LeCh32-8]MBP0598064.1 helix-turn-helix transcriptional regulator [Herbaspirillum sp. LeCh32-8]